MFAAKFTVFKEPGQTSIRVDYLIPYVLRYQVNFEAFNSHHVSFITLADLVGHFLLKDPNLCIYTHRALVYQIF